MATIKLTNYADYVNNYDNYQYGTANHTWYLLKGEDVLYGGTGRDTVYGGDGADISMAVAVTTPSMAIRGWDTLYGDAGTDVIYGGNGNDTLDGSYDTPVRRIVWQYRQ